jgi:hypothetical protein
MSDDTRYPLSERLKMASMAAFEKGDTRRGTELADAAKAAHWQECCADYEYRQARERGGRER